MSTAFNEDHTGLSFFFMDLKLCKTEIQIQNMYLVENCLCAMQIKVQMFIIQPKKVEF